MEGIPGQGKGVAAQRTWATGVQREERDRRQVSVSPEGGSSASHSCQTPTGGGGWGEAHGGPFITHKGLLPE